MYPSQRSTHPFLNSMISVIEKQTIPQLADENKEITQVDVKTSLKVNTLILKASGKI